MAKVQRACTECGTPLETDNPRARTCSAKCRQKRKSRKDRHAEHMREGLTRGDALAEHMDLHPEAVNDAITKELQPLVREAITEETLAGISGLLNLLPTAVEKLAEDLQHPNASVRQRAYMTALKYTVGQQALVGDVKDDSKQIHVNFNLPRPGDEQTVEAPPDSIEEVKECDTCHADKPLSEFVSGSDRCRTCFNDLRERVISHYSEGSEQDNAGDQDVKAINSD